MIRQPVDARTGATASSYEDGSAHSPEESERAREDAFRKQADTLTAPGIDRLRLEGDDDGSTAKIRRKAPRRDTMPAPPLALMNDAAAPSGDVQVTDDGTLATTSGGRSAPLPTLDMSTAYLSPFPLRTLPPPMLPEKRVEETVDDEDIIDGSDLDDDTTQALREPFTPSEEPTSPAVCLPARCDSAREVYRLFLASDYPSALALANALIEQGDSDAMLVTIARECRASLENAEGRASSSAPPTAPDGEAPYESQSRLFAGIHGKMTLEQLAATTGMSLDQVLNLLERFVSMGVITLRPPPR